MILPCTHPLYIFKFFLTLFYISFPGRGIRQQTEILRQSFMHAPDTSSLLSELQILRKLTCSSVWVSRMPVVWETITYDNGS